MTTPPKVYKEEVLGQRCSIYFYVNNNRATGMMYWGTIQEYRAVLQGNNFVKHEHRITYDEDGDDLWHDLGYEESQQRLRWPKQDQEEDDETKQVDISGPPTPGPGPDQVMSNTRLGSQAAASPKVKREIMIVKREPTHCASTSGGVIVGKGEQKSNIKGTPPRPDGVVSSS